MRSLAFLAPLVLIACGTDTERPYRIPYADGVDVRVTQDDTTHSTPPARMFDLQGIAPDEVIVAAAPGWIREIQDDQQGTSLLNNYVWIEHPLDYCQPPGGITTRPDPPSECETCPQGLGKCNEWTLYAHMQFRSVTDLGLSEGSWVNEGQPIGVEGDTGCGQFQPPCARHLHFNVFTIDRDALAAANQPTNQGDYEDWATHELLFGAGVRPERVPLFCTADGLRRIRMGEVHTAGPCPPLL